jgi:hypothetical protein
MTLESELRNSAVMAGAGSILFFAGCSVPNDAPPELAVQTTHESAAASTPLRLSGDNLAFLADEATSGPGGTDFNHDNDTLDTVPVVVNMQGATEIVIAVQAENVAWLTNELFMVTDEVKDGRDWSGDGNMTDLVLLHWSYTFQTAVFIDVVARDPNPSAPTPRMIAVGSNLFYVSGGPAPVGPNTSTINVVTNISPLTHAPVPTDDGTGPLSPSLLVQNEFMVFLSLDEVTDARDLDGDTDAVDTHVLALLDGTTSSPLIHNVGLALPDEKGPFRASQTTTPNDWQVGFLVSETDQGGTNFNNYTVGAAHLTASWEPAQCIGHEDNDTLDNVLFYLNFASWVSDPVANPPRNTGLVGSQSIAMANGFVSTISVEADQGTCDLNSNGETTDHVVRWTQMVSGDNTPILPLNDPANIHALFDVPGGTHGLSELQQGSSRVFIIEASESADNQDINGDGFKTFNLLGWLLPSNTPTPWDFTQSGSNNAFVSASWLGQQPDRSRLDAGLQEIVQATSLNPGGDSDILDSVPTFGVFNGSNMIFPGVAVAVEKNNAGIAAVNNYGFFRVDEASDNRDWDGDGDKADVVLMRVSFTQSTTAVMGTVIPGLPGPAIPVLFQEPQNGGAFLFNEASYGASGTDINGDLTVNPFVAYFHF